MWTWLINLWNSVRGMEIPEEQHIPRKTEQNRRIQAKTKSIYPKEREGQPAPVSSRDRPRHFRFPVIPDQEKGERQQDDYQDDYQVPGRQDRRESYVTEERQLRRRKDTKQETIRPDLPAKQQGEQAGFIPLEVFSPIYGRIEQKSVESRQENQQASQPEQRSSINSQTPHWLLNDWNDLKVQQEQKELNEQKVQQEQIDLKEQKVQQEQRDWEDRDEQHEQQQHGQDQQLEQHEQDYQRYPAVDHQASVAGKPDMQQEDSVALPSPMMQERRTEPNEEQPPATDHSLHSWLSIFEMRERSRAERETTGIAETAATQQLEEQNEPNTLAAASTGSDTYHLDTKQSDNALAFSSNEVGTEAESEAEKQAVEAYELAVEPKVDADAEKDAEEQETAAGVYELEVEMADTAGVDMYLEAEEQETAAGVYELEVEMADTAGVDMYLEAVEQETAAEAYELEVESEDTADVDVDAEAVEQQSVAEAYELGVNSEDTADIDVHAEAVEQETVAEAHKLEVEMADTAGVDRYLEAVEQVTAAEAYEPKAESEAKVEVVEPKLELEPEPEPEPEPIAEYQLPPTSLLAPSPQATEDDNEYTEEQKRLLEETLANFNVNANVVGIVKGPSVTRFELQPAPGVKVNKITSLSDDIKLSLSAKDIRIEAPIPGRNAVGIEVPNAKSVPVFISRILESERFQAHPSPLAIALGMDIGGEPIVADIKKMPHGLIAGSTGSGKSVCINSIIVSLLFKAKPEQVRLLLIDPKMVELAPYNHLPHLVTPVVTDAKQATASLKWAVEEMERRYAAFVDAGVRDIDRYNLTTPDPLPYIVIIIDELADLMMVSPQDVEDCIIRIAQKARACGIHLLLATQRPSVDVITGNIKANVPTRLAFAVFSQIDSRTILDQSGAERLLGRGDMLFLESGATPIRLQGNFVSDDEIDSVTQMIKKQRKPNYYFSKEDLEQSVQAYDAGDDPLYAEALVFVAEQGQASASSLQRRFRIGYNRAARLIEMMEAEGHVAGQSGGKPRAVLISREDAQALTEGAHLL